MPYFFYTLLSPCTMRPGFQGCLTDMGSVIFPILRLLPSRRNPMPTNRKNPHLKGIKANILHTGRPKPFAQCFHWHTMYPIW